MTIKRNIERTSQFKKDYKREMKGQYRGNLKEDLVTVLKKLEADEALAPKYKDHPLIGNWRPKQECHIKPDLLLIYEKKNLDTLILVRLGSHSELSL